MSVFVEEGTGGVGHVAIQTAKSHGARVFAACCKEEKCRIAKDLGAERAFNYREASSEEMVAASPGGRGFEVVFNTPGTASIDQSVLIAAFDGTILDILGHFPTAPGFQMKWLKLVSVFAGHSILMDVNQDSVGRILKAATDLVEKVKLRPVVDPKRSSLSDVGKAHAYAEHEHLTGKIVLSNP